MFAPSLLPEASRTHLEGPRVATPASCHREVPAALGPYLIPTPFDSQGGVEFRAIDSFSISAWHGLGTGCRFPLGPNAGRTLDRGRYRVAWRSGEASTSRIEPTSAGTRGCQ